MTPPTDSWIQSLADEHARLGLLLARVKDRLSETIDESSRPELLLLLEELAAGCRAHMEYEERDGYMKPVLEQLPNLFETIEALCQEHTTLQTDLAGIIDDVRAKPNVDEMWQSVAPCVKTWLDDIHAHEAKENQLVQETLNTDLGTGD